jgi:hypothetical protein
MPASATKPSSPATMARMKNVRAQPSMVAFLA